MNSRYKKYKFDEQPNKIIAYNDTGIPDRIKNGPYSCVIGPNNAGKSLLLKNIAIEIGETATYLGPARYNNFNSLAPYAPKKNRRSNSHQQLLQ